MEQNQVLEKILSEVSGVKTHVADLHAKVTTFESTLVGLDAKVTGLDAKVTGLDAKVTGLDAKVTGLDAKVTGLDAKVTTLESNHLNLDTKIDLVFAAVVDIKEYVKENLVTREEFDEKIGELYNHVDGFIKLHTTLDQELVALHHKYDRLEARLVRVESKLGLAAA